MRFLRGVLVFWFGSVVSRCVIFSDGSRVSCSREQAVVIETDSNYTGFDKANPFCPERGNQWGSGWHQLANEWDWYI